MKFPWRSLKAGMRFASTRVVDSRIAPGVRYRIATMSFGRRIELMTRIRELARRAEFLRASEDAGDRMDAGLLRSEIDRVYLDWGLKEVSGLTIDGVRADAAGLMESGPEELCREALAAIRAETGLSEEERKN